MFYGSKLINRTFLAYSLHQMMKKPLKQLQHVNKCTLVLSKGFLRFVTVHNQFEPPRDKTNKMACVPSEDSDQLGHPPSLMRVFAVRIKKAQVLSYPLSAQRRLIRLGGCPADLSLRWAHMPFCWFCHEAAQLLFLNEP